MEKNVTSTMEELSELEQDVLAGSSNIKAEPFDKYHEHGQSVKCFHRRNSSELCRINAQSLPTAFPTIGKYQKYIYIYICFYPKSPKQKKLSKCKPRICYAVQSMNCFVLGESWWGSTFWVFGVKHWHPNLHKMAPTILFERWISISCRCASFGN